VDDRRAGRASYQDPLISIRDGTLTIRRYYFPDRGQAHPAGGDHRGRGVRHDQGHRQVADLGSGDLIH
jgi:hypothetical protein